MGPVTPPRQMAIYTVQENEDGSAEQASMLVVHAHLDASDEGLGVIKANIGRGESPREDETTTDKDGEGDE